MFHPGVQIEVSEVNAVERCAGSINNRVEKQFCGGEIVCWHALTPRVVDAISTHVEPSSVWLILLRIVVAENTPYIYVCSFGTSNFLMKKQSASVTQETVNLSSMYKQGWWHPRDDTILTFAMFWQAFICFRKHGSDI